MTFEKLDISLASDPSEPLYKQIKQLIISRVDNGQWSPGDKIPTEHNLVQELNASRMTVNRALRELTQEGILVRRQGSGTYVSPPRLETGLLEIRNIAEDIERRGGQHTSEVLHLSEELPPKDIAGLLHMPEKTPCFHSLCLHLENGEAIQLEDRYVTPSLVPKFLQQDFTVQTTGGYLLANVPYTHADHRIRAALPTEEQANCLGLSEGEPVLVLERRTYCPEGVITIVRLYHPSSRFEFGGTFIPDRE
ncbi:MAG: histidine utilization repressor [Sneathiella sp.]